MMGAIWSLETDLVTQDYDTPSSGPHLAKIELTIPDGMSVVGCGAAITHIWDTTTETLVPVDSLSESLVATQLNGYHFHDGPHPSDPSKWRVMFGSGGTRVRARAWIAVVGQGA